MEDTEIQGERDRRALRELTRLLSQTGLSFESTVEQVLDLGCGYLDVDVAFLSFVEPERNHFEIRHARGDHPALQAGATAPLDETYCQQTVEMDGLHAVDDAFESAQVDSAAAERFEIAR